MISVSGNSGSDLSNVEKLKKCENDKRMQRKSQEDHMTLTVGVILVAYLICNLPASVVLLIDPSATKITQVLIQMLETSDITKLCRLIFPATSSPGSLQSLNLLCMSFSTLHTNKPLKTHSRKLNGGKLTATSEKENKYSFSICAVERTIKNLNILLHTL